MELLISWRGLKDSGPTKSGHKSPAVIAELPFDGINKENVQANSWIIKQILAKGAWFNFMSCK